MSTLCPSSGKANAVSSIYAPSAILSLRTILPQRSEDTLKPLNFSEYGLIENIVRATICVIADITGSTPFFSAVVATDTNSLVLVGVSALCPVACLTIDVKSVDT